MRTLRSRNVGLVWVTHHLEELIGLADRATIFRDGRNAGTVEVAETSIEQFLAYMFGEQREEFGAGDTRHLNRLTPLDDAPIVLSAKGLTRGSVVRDVSFEVHEGEVIGLAGLAGAGRTEVVRTLMGLDRLTSGTIELDGRRISPRSSAAAYRRRSRDAARRPQAARHPRRHADRRQHLALQAAHGQLGAVLDQRAPRTRTGRGATAHASGSRPRA